MLRYLARYCLVGIAVFVFSLLYWAGWRKIIPRLFGYRLVPGKDTLADGTVLMVVSEVLPCHWDRSSFVTSVHARESQKALVVMDGERVR